MQTDTSPCDPSASCCGGHATLTIYFPPFAHLEPRIEIEDFLQKAEAMNKLLGIGCGPLPHFRQTPD